MRKVLALLNSMYVAFRSLKNKIYQKVDPIAYAKSQGVKIGKNCRLINVKFGSEPYLITLGDHVSATETRFITHDGGVWVFRDKEPDIDVLSPIKVGNNVFLGLGVIVMPGVAIGDNVVIGAGAVVVKDIPSNTVAVGVPAKPIKTIAEYRESIGNNIFTTKSLSLAEKRKYFENYFDLKRP
jgi:acetyltransferase-like isoleucine patch superfamily enzyme